MVGPEPSLQGVLAVAAGSAAGGVLRHWISTSLEPGWTPDAGFPWGTLAVNFCGCVIAGALAGLPGGNLRLLVVTGFCGGFTTLSAVGVQTLGLATAGQMRLALSLAVLSLGACLFGAFGGAAAVRLLLRFF